MTAHVSRPAASRAARGWRRYLVLAALTCMVGLYSLQVMHVHLAVKSSLVYPKSQVERPLAAENQLPDLTAALSFRTLYHFTVADSDYRYVHLTLRLKPQSRAPPSRYS